MAKIIDIKKYFKERERRVEETWYGDGIKAFNLVDEKLAEDISTFVMQCIFTECEIGLMLGEFNDEKYIDVETPLFDEIDAMYQESEKGCYFCDTDIDPNSEEFGLNTQLCIMCQLKVANILTQV